ERLMQAFGHFFAPNRAQMIQFFSQSLQTFLGEERRFFRQHTFGSCNGKTAGVSGHYSPVRLSFKYIENDDIVKPVFIFHLSSLSWNVQAGGCRMIPFCVSHSLPFSLWAET